MSGAYDPLAQRAAETDSQPANANTYDPLALVAAGKPLPAANDSTPASSTPKWESDWLAHGNPVNQFVQGAFDQGIKSTAGAIAGGLKGLWDIATGRSSAAPSDVEQLEQHTAYQPQTPAQEAGAAVASSNWNPLNWPGVALSKTVQFLGNTAERLGAPPLVSTALDVAPSAIASYYGLKGAGIKPGEGYVPEVERVTPEEVSAPVENVSTPEPEGPPVDGGLPKEAQAERAAILKRVGITQARKSAVEGDAKAAATDYQVNKTDEPAGREASAQFEHERNALTDFTQRQIVRVGGSIGTDEDALINRGQAISKPFDDLRQWFKDRTNQLYEQADANARALRGGVYDTKTGTTSLTNLEGVDRLLNNRSFKNSLAAQDRTSLLNAARDQLDYFRENNPNGFTVKTAEQYRQWLNQQWSPQNSWAIGQLKNAVDDDVLKNAGENVYAAARAMRVLKSKTLDDPKGIAQLFDSDPLT
ncbi:MAG TPA: hypothetical protein VJQ82_22385, partial [Terriglobales bacterium]|nr:hypothetical protein [Terriglobales bacterium]